MVVPSALLSINHSSALRIVINNNKAKPGERDERKVSDVDNGLRTVVLRTIDFTEIA
jgi:hypothetical protein